MAALIVVRASNDEGVNLPARSGGVAALALSDDATLLAVARTNGAIEIWHLGAQPTLSIEHRLDAGSPKTLLFAKRGDGERLIYPTALGRVAIEDAQSGVVADDAFPQSAVPPQIVETGDGAIWASGVGVDDLRWVARLAPGGTAAKVIYGRVILPGPAGSAPQAGPIQWFAADDAKRTATGDRDATFAVRLTPLGHDAVAAIDATGHVVRLSAGSSGAIRPGPSWDKVLSFDGAGQPIYAQARDGQSYGLVGALVYPLLSDVALAQAYSQVPLSNAAESSNGAESNRAALSADGRFVLTWSTEYKSPKLWNARDGSEIGKIYDDDSDAAAEAATAAATFTADSALLAIRNNKGLAIVDAKTGRELQNLPIPLSKDGLQQNISAEFVDG
ncbi:MAG TPA: hypothetical protein VHZ29_15685, partial [Rhizomicrobium sp.]|nr:hypothetical protein [Rhizomicrobium sp.]